MRNNYKNLVPTLKCSCEKKIFLVVFLERNFAEFCQICKRKKVRCLLSVKLKLQTTENENTEKSLVYVAIDFFN